MWHAGGPGASDDYTDKRNDFVKNEVATDYNAGFTGGPLGPPQASGFSCSVPESLSAQADSTTLLLLFRLQEPWQLLPRASSADLRLVR
jgi:hypothetical protein